MGKNKKDIVYLIVGNKKQVLNIEKSLRKIVQMYRVKQDRS